MRIANNMTPFLSHESTNDISYKVRQGMAANSEPFVASIKSRTQHIILITARVSKRHDDDKLASSIWH